MMMMMSYLKMRFMEMGQLSKLLETTHGSVVTVNNFY